MNIDKVKTCVVFAAHPDDEIIGPGGTIIRLTEQGAKVVVVLFTLGGTGYANVADKDKIMKIREKELTRSQKILGYQERVILDKPCQGVCDDRDTYHQCMKIIRKYKPQLILTHYFEDKHRDHRAISDVTTEAWWKASENLMHDIGKPWRAPELYYYEGGEYITHPSVIVDITKTINKKVKAMSINTSQLDVLGSVVERVKGLAVARGWLGDCDYGEAFIRSNFMATKI
ncbi:MAG: PIG-L family deacetylase [Elusimicrobiota bacterium]